VGNPKKRYSDVTTDDTLDRQKFRQSCLAIASAKAKEVQSHAPADTFAPHLLLPDHIKTVLHNG